MSEGKNKHEAATRAARAGIDEDEVYGAVTPPLHLSSNFSFESYAKERAYNYTRSGNPTRDTLGKALAEMEGGYHAVVTSTGISALDLAFQLVEKDGLILAPFDCYGGTHRLLSARARQGHYRVKFVDMTGSLDDVFSEKAAMVLIETPSNPLMRLTDIAAVCARAKKDGALVVVDNTFLPLLQKPLALGADIVMHSTTKYINGHSDVVGGALVSKTKELHDKLSWWANCTGVAGAPFDSFLTLRGLRTLDVRMARQQETAREIVAFLGGHPAVGKVYYPDMGAMLTFSLKGDMKAFLDALCTGEGHLFTLAVSLGGFESLVAHPATMSHASMPAAARAAAGIGDDLVRLSIGLEAPTDLKNALSAALAKAV